MEQAEAAGVAEGFLTFPLILPHYEARVHRALCLPHPQFCQFCRRVFKQQLELVERMVERWGSQASYYKMVGLFYSQLEGLRLGLELRQSAHSPALSPSLDLTWWLPCYTPDSRAPTESACGAHMTDGSVRSVGSQDICCSSS